MGTMEQKPCGVGVQDTRGLTWRHCELEQAISRVFRLVFFGSELAKLGGFLDEFGLDRLGVKRVLQ